MPSQTLIGKITRRVQHAYLRSCFHVMDRLGMDTPARTPDRAVLEEILFPYYLALPDISKVLFVGCASYTKHYRKMFSEVEYWTIDFNAHNKRYGAHNHIVDSLENLDSHFSPSYFDIIFCNGVYGHGLNEKLLVRERLQAVLTACGRAAISSWAGTTCPNSRLCR